MPSRTITAARDRVVGITPFREPNADLVVAIERAGRLGVLDLGMQNAAAARAALDRVRSRWGGPFGVRIAAGCPLSPADLPAEVDTILIGPDSAPGSHPAAASADTQPDAAAADIWWMPGLAERRRGGYSRSHLTSGGSRGGGGAAPTAWSPGGTESGGRVGDASTFVLVQHLVDAVDVPVWAMGGIGVHTAAAAIAAGAPAWSSTPSWRWWPRSTLPADVAAACGHGRQRDHRDRRPPGLRHARTCRRSLRADAGTFRMAAALGAETCGPSCCRPVRTPRSRRRSRARYRTAGGLVRAFAALAHLTSHVSTRWRPGSPFAAAHGAGPGPDDAGQRPGRVRRRGRRGGRPAVPRPGPDAGRRDPRGCSAETAALLGDRPWGVGILGFAPAEVREAQLEVVHAARPPCALIAGGRPSQAAAAGGGRDRRRSCTCRRPACWTASCRTAPAGSSSRAPNAAGTSGRARASRCGRRRSSACSRCADLDEMRACSFAGGVHDEPLGRHGRRHGGAAGRAGRRGRRADGHRLPVHRRGRADPARSCRHSSRPRATATALPCWRPLPATSCGAPTRRT